MKSSRDVRHRKEWKAKMLPAQPAPFCVCGEPLTFGSHPLSGRAFQWCGKCGEQPIPRAGVRHYEQGRTLTLELAAGVERAKAPPQETTSCHQAGKQWRQRRQQYASGN